MHDNKIKKDMDLRTDSFPSQQILLFSFTTLTLLPFILNINHIKKLSLEERQKIVVKEFKFPICTLILQTEH